MCVFNDVTSFPDPRWIVSSSIDNVFRLSDADAGDDCEKRCRALVKRFGISLDGCYLVVAVKDYAILVARERLPNPLENEGETLRQPGAVASG
jgi:hypothetical protein